MLSKASVTVLKSHNCCQIARAFGIKSVPGKKRAWSTHEYRPEIDRPKYIVPEERVAALKEAEAEFINQDFKSKLLEARHYQVEPRVEEDIIFGTKLPETLPLTRIDYSEMFVNEKSYAYDYLLKM